MGRIGRLHGNIVRKNIRWQQLKNSPSVKKDKDFHYKNYLYYVLLIIF